MRRIMIVVAAVAALSACGSPAASGREVASLSTAPADDATSSTDEVTGTTAVLDPGEAALKYAECMREHGVDMPDPVVQNAGDGTQTGGVMINIGGGDGQPVDPKEMEAANEECQHFMEDAAGSFDPPSAEEQEKMKEQTLAFAKCMREHGVDMPDPQFGDNGTFSIGFAGGPGDTSGGPPADFDSEEFQAASKACGQDGGFGFSVSAGTVP